MVNNIDHVCDIAVSYNCISEVCYLTKKYYLYVILLSSFIYTIHVLV